MLLPVLLAMSAAALAPAGAPTAATEMMGIDVPDAFEVGHRARVGAVEIVELVEPPETMESWSRLVTSLMFFDAAKDGLEPFYERWRGRLRNTCAGLSDSAMRGSVDGHPALRATLSCPANPASGRPETIEAILVQGSANLMMVQLAFRRPPTAEDIGLVERVAGSVKVCDERTLASCSARVATGFVPGG